MKKVCYGKEKLVKIIAFVMVGVLIFVSPICLNVGMVYAEEGTGEDYIEETTPNNAEENTESEITTVAEESSDIEVTTIAEESSVVEATTIAEESSKTEVTTVVEKETTKKAKKVKVAKAVIKKITKKSSKKIQLTLKKLSKVKGYQIRIYTSSKNAKKNKKAFLKATVNQNIKKVTLKSAKFKTKETVYVRVRAYKISNKKKIYGAWSTTKKIVINKKKKGGTTQNKVENTDIQQVVDLVNKERTAAGVSKVKLDETLKNAAMKRAEELAKSFSHTRPDGRAFYTIFDEFKIEFWNAGENIAAGASSPQEAMNNWMKSTMHKGNILNADFKKIGVGYYKTADGTEYWLQLFI